MAPDLTFRQAVPADADGVFACFEEVAAEIPARVDGADRRRALLNRFRADCSSEYSWVAAAGKMIAGFVLVEPDQEERDDYANGAVHVAFAGVSAAHRQNGVFRRLMAPVLAAGVPVTATVKHQNLSEMAARLARLGFAKVPAVASDFPGEDRFRRPADQITKLVTR